MRRISAIIVILFLSSFINEAMAEETLTWEDCVKEAKTKHPDLISAWEKVNQAKASREATRSTYLPQISSSFSETTVGTQGKGGGSNQTSSASGTQGGSGGSSSTQITTYQYSVSGQQLLFDGFKTSYDLSSAERSITASRYNYDVTSSNIRLRLRTAFADLLNAQELLNVTESIAGRRKQNLELVKLRYEGGREHKGSLLTSEADMAGAEYEVEQARRNIYLSQRRLVKELGRTTTNPLMAKGDFEVKYLERERPDFEKLAQANPLLQQLIAQREAAKFGVHSATAQFFPQIFANGSATKSETTWPPDRNSWSVGTSVSFPIFEGGLRFATLSKAKAAFAQALADERSGKDGVILTMADTWTKLQDAVEQVAVQKKFLQADTERAKIAEAEYSIGLLSFDNWIIIEDNLVSTKKNYLNAQTNALAAEANWVQARGGTLDYD